MSEATTVQTKTPAAAQVQTVTDSLGRVLTIRELGPVEQIDLFEAAGEQSGNNSWIGMAIIAACVIDIDGVPVPFPHNKTSIRGLLKRLGSEGVSAAAKALREDLSAAQADTLAIAKN